MPVMSSQKPRCVMCGTPGPCSVCLLCHSQGVDPEAVRQALDRQKERRERARRQKRDEYGCFAKGTT